MRLEDIVYQRLSSDLEIYSFVSGRITPSQPTQGTDWPFLVYYTSGAVYQYGLNGPQQRETPLTVDCVAFNFDDAVHLANMVSSCLVGYSELPYLKIIFGGDRQEIPQENFYMVTLTFRCFQ
jgi:hypothetical protein